MFLARDDVEEAFRRSFNNKIFLGHTRYATQGSIKDENAHPFHHEHILLAHNGSIFNKDSLPDGNKFAVDSEAICHSIAKIGAVETLKLVNGAFALSYYDFDERKFNLIRNTERSLYIAKHKNKKTWYYASEGEILFLILRRNKIEFEKIVEVEKSTLYSFDLRTNDLEQRKVDYTRVYTPPSKEYWYNGDACSYGGKSDEDDTKSNPLPPASTVSDITSRLGTQAKMWRADLRDKGRFGTGLEYLGLWGLKLRDWVRVSVSEEDIEKLNPSTTYCKTYGFFTGKVTPDNYGADVVIQSFTKEDFLKIKNDRNSYFTQVTMCYYSKDEDRYIIRCSDLRTGLPIGQAVVFPHDMTGLFGKIPLAALKAPEKKEEPIVATPVTREPTFGELQLMSECIAEQQAALEASFRTPGEDDVPGKDDEPEYKETDLVEGPNNSRIYFTNWMDKTARGCGYCTGTIPRPDDCKWIGDDCVHNDCYETMVKSENGVSKTK